MVPCTETELAPGISFPPPQPSKSHFVLLEEAIDQGCEFGGRGEGMGWCVCSMPGPAGEGGTTGLRHPIKVVGLK